MVDYGELLRKDLVEQFRGKEKIETILGALGTQLNDLRKFYEDLRDYRNVHTAIGEQLDMCGDITGRSREAAAKMAYLQLADMEDDELYRKYILQKMLANSTSCTYDDVIGAFKMLYDDAPIYYTEDPDRPATIILQVPLSGDEGVVPAVTDNLTIKPGGVAVEFHYKVGSKGIIIGESMAVWYNEVPECGTLYCGTWWMTSTYGWSENHGVEIGAKTDAYAVSHDYCGTLPNISKLGYSASEGTLLSAGVDSYAVSSGVSGGGDSSGELPNEATVGYSTSAASLLSVASAARGYTAQPAVCGLPHCGQDE